MKGDAPSQRLETIVALQGDAPLSPDGTMP